MTDKANVMSTIRRSILVQGVRRGFATKVKQSAPPKKAGGGTIHKGNGIYTAHVEKLFKLQNGYFILFLHKQAVSISHVYKLYRL